jgi:hypothetical protein
MYATNLSNHLFLVPLVIYHRKHGIVPHSSDRRGADAMSAGDPFLQDTQDQGVHAVQLLDAPFCK